MPSIKLYLIKLKQNVVGFFHKKATDNSGFGKALQLGGFAAFLYGTWLIYHPLPFLLGGAAVLIAGEQL